MHASTYDPEADLRKVPPFIDSHMHFPLQGRPSSLSDLEAIRNQYLRFGVFAANDMGDKFGTGFLARSLLKEDLVVRTAGYALFKKGTYGIFLGRGLEGKEEIKSAVRRLAETGADFVKAINSGIVSVSGGRLVTKGGFSKEELRVLCEESAARDLKVACHANSDCAIRDAVLAGVSSIEHGFFVSKETLHMMAEMKVPWTPTAFALLRLSASLPAGQKAYVGHVVEEHLESIRFASEAGVKLRIGTDSGAKGSDYGRHFVEELRLFRKAGLSRDQILSAACMAEEEIDKGNYLLVKGDFIDTGVVSCSKKPAAAEEDKRR